MDYAGLSKNSHYEWLHSTNEELIDQFAHARTVTITSERTTAAGLIAFVWSGFVMVLLSTIVVWVLILLCLKVVGIVVPTPRVNYDPFIAGSLLFAAIFAWIALRGSPLRAYKNRHSETGIKSVVLDLEHRMLVSAEIYDRFPERNKTTSIELRKLRVAYWYSPGGDDVPSHCGVNIELKVEGNTGINFPVRLWSGRSRNNEVIRAFVARTGIDATFDAVEGSRYELVDSLPATLKHDNENRNIPAPIDREAPTVDRWRTVPGSSTVEIAKRIKLNDRRLEIYCREWAPDKRVNWWPNYFVLYFLLYSFIAVVPVIMLSGDDKGLAFFLFLFIALPIIAVATWRTGRRDWEERMQYATRTQCYIDFETRELVAVKETFSKPPEVTSTACALDELVLLCHSVRDGEGKAFIEVALVRSTEVDQVAPRVECQLYRGSGTTSRHDGQKVAEAILSRTKIYFIDRSDSA